MEFTPSDRLAAEIHFARARESLRALASLLQATHPGCHVERAAHRDHDGDQRARRCRASPRCERPRFRAHGVPVLWPPRDADGNRVRVLLAQAQSVGCDGDLPMTGGGSTGSHEVLAARAELTAARADLDAAVGAMGEPDDEDRMAPAFLLFLLFRAVAARDRLRELEIPKGPRSS